ncbi:hypothetical protein R6Q59_027984 [Mikania micrantha]
MQLICNLKSTLSAEGLNNFEFIYIGGLRVMISFLSLQLAKECLEKKTSWKHIFNNLEIWNGQDIPFERVAGLRIHGVPLALRDECTYNKIALSFGKIIWGSEFSWNNAIVSYNFVYVLVNHGSFISEKGIFWQKCVLFTFEMKTGLVNKC